MTTQTPEELASELARLLGYPDACSWLAAVGVGKKGDEPRIVIYAKRKPHPYAWKRHLADGRFKGCLVELVVSGPMRLL